jgi:hypothetical protein
MIVSIKAGISSKYKGLVSHVTCFLKNRAKQWSRDRYVGHPTQVVQLGNARALLQNQYIDIQNNNCYSILLLALLKIDVYIP